MARVSVQDTRLQMKLPHALRDLIDDVRGSETRSAFLRSAAIKEALSRKNARAISSSWQASQTP